MGRRRLLLWAVVLACVSLSPGQAAARATESQVKTAFVYNITKFTVWPAKRFPSKSTPLRICTVGRGSLSDSLKAVSKRSFKSRKIKVERVSSLSRLTRCHVVVVSQSDKGRLVDVLKATRNYPILTVSDIHGFSRSGGIVELVVIRNKVRLHINLEASERAGVELSSKLLGLATLVSN